MNLAKTLSLALVVGAGLAFGAPDAAAQGRGRGAVAPDDYLNDLAKKYMDYDASSPGNVAAQPKGVLKTLMEQKAHENLAASDAGADAIAGKLGAEYKELFADLIKVRDTKSKVGGWYLVSHPQSSAKNLHPMAMMGIGYLGMRDQVPGLMKQIDGEERLSDFGRHKTILIDTLWRLQAKDQVPKIVELLKNEKFTTTHRFRALEYLNAWGSDAAVDWAKSSLTDKDDQTVKSCLLYLGWRKHVASAPMMVRLIEKHGAHAIRALGLSGAADKKGALEEILAKYPNKNQYTYRVPVLGALVNLGDDSKWQELAELIAAGGAGSAEAAMETVLVRSDNKLSKDINDALTAASKATGKQWYAPVYAALALAQRGDAGAVDTLMGMLDSSNSEVRAAVLDGVGGEENPHGPGFHKRGLGVVADERLIAKLLECRSMESSNEPKLRTVIAAAAIRAAVANKKA